MFVLFVFVCNFKEINKNNNKFQHKGSQKDSSLVKVFLIFVEEILPRFLELFIIKAYFLEKGIFILFVRVSSIEF